MTVDPGKNFVGQRGFPTPDSTPETSACRTFRVPDNDDWLGVLMGAVEVLQNPYNWYQWGSMTPEEAAAAWNDILIQTYLDSLTLPCPVTTVDTPFWDEATDVDDEAEDDVQPWYGKVEDPTVAPDDLTFIEDATIWAFTGLLAVASGGAGLAPAIAFRTIAPKFVVAIRTGDLGRIIRLFVDGEKAAEVTDDGSGDIVNMPIIGDPALDSHQIYITAE